MRGTVYTSLLELKEMKDAKERIKHFEESTQKVIDLLNHSIANEQLKIMGYPIFIVALTLHRCPYHYHVCSPIQSSNGRLIKLFS